MRVLVLGGDGYLGWPTAMRFAAKGHDVMAVDNYLRRTIAKATSSEPLVDSPDLIERARIFESASNYKVRVEIGDCCDYPFLKGIFEKFQPDSVVHYAEQPSAPYSMMGYAGQYWVRVPGIDWPGLVFFLWLWGVPVSGLGQAQGTFQRALTTLLDLYVWLLRSTAA